jgi:NAD(P)-dependent dehydrogenase (short-subunit alcohol dehydrogenase family)
VLERGGFFVARAILLQSGYCGAKHAIRGFIDSIRCELAHRRSSVWLTMVQMPALNTPQFDSCENKMGRASQPVPPFHQPELGWIDVPSVRRSTYTARG